MLLPTGGQEDRRGHTGRKAMNRCVGPERGETERRVVPALCRVVELKMESR